MLVLEIFQDFNIQTKQEYNELNKKIQMILIEKEYLVKKIKNNIDIIMDKLTQIVLIKIKKLILKLMLKEKQFFHIVLL